jgi:cytidine deaminase
MAPNATRAINELQRLIGNRSVTRLLQARPTKPPRSHQASANAARHLAAGLQRSKAADGGRREATVTVTWSDDDGEFFRAAVAAVARSKQFKGLGRAALYQPMHRPVIALHNALALRLGSAFHGRVELRVTAVASDGWVSAVTVEQSHPEAGQRPAPPDAATVAAAESGVAAVILRMLGNATAHGTTSADIDLINRYGELEMAAWHSRGGSGSADVDWQSTRNNVRQILDLVSLATHSTLVYSVHLKVSGGVWRADRMQRLAEVLPIPEPTVSTGSGEGWADEGQQAIDDVKASRRLVLDTAAALIQEQDPSRLSNLVMLVAPFAVVKLAKVGRLARIRRLSNLRDLKVPNVSALFRGRYSVTAKLDQTLVQTARELRASQAGIRLEDFSRTNIAVARVRIDNEVQYLDAGNIQAAVVGANRGYDSEQMIVTQVMELRKQGKKVSIEQLYSERIPCVTCTKMLDDHFPEAAIFYTVPESRRLGEVTRGEALMRAYGLTPP